MTQMERDTPTSLALDPTTDRVIVIEVIVVILLAVLPDLWAAVTPRPEGFKYTVPLMAARNIPRSIANSAVVLYLIWRSGRSWADFGIRRLHFVQDCLGGICVTMLLFIAYYSAFRILYVVLGADIYAKLAANSTTPSSIFVGPQTSAQHVLLVLIMLLNGFAEELAMRGYLIRRFEQIFESTPLALLLTTCLFAAYHAYQGAIGIIGSAVIGLVVGGIFCRFRRLWPIAFAHAILDVISLMQLKHA